MAIVYQHRRLDTGEVFYVGIGKSEKRAYSIHNRNKHWKNIINKHGYIVEITHRNIIWEEACAIERYLIAFYGRKDLNGGVLVNMTDGGDGIYNLSIEIKQKMGIKAKNRILSDKQIETLKKYAKDKKIPVLQYNINGEYINEYSSIAEAAMTISGNSTSISRCCKGINKSHLNYIWRYKDNNLWFLPVYVKTKFKNSDRSYKDNFKNKNEKSKKSVIQYDLNGNFIKKWEYIKQISDKLKINNSKISDCCKNKKGRKSAGGFIWRYADDDKWFEPSYVSFKNSKDVVEKRKKKLMKPILQFDKMNNFLKEWESATTVGKTLNINISAILACCNQYTNRNTSGGFIWKFKN